MSLQNFAQDAAKAIAKAPIYIYRYTFKAFVGQNHAANRQAIGRGLNVGELRGNTGCMKRSSILTLQKPMAAVARFSDGVCLAGCIFVFVCFAAPDPRFCNVNGKYPGGSPSTSTAPFKGLREPVLDIRHFSNKIGTWHGLALMVSRLNSADPAALAASSCAVSDQHHAFAPWRCGRWR